MDKDAIFESDMADLERHFRRTDGFVRIPYTDLLDVLTTLNNLVELPRSPKLPFDGKLFDWLIQEVSAEIERRSNSDAQEGAWILSVPRCSRVALAELFMSIENISALETWEGAKKDFWHGLRKSLARIVYKVLLEDHAFFEKAELDRFMIV